MLIEKASVPSKTQPTTSTRDTITYETEKDIKKHQSPSSSTPLLYANNVQSYQHAPTSHEQLQQKSAPILLTQASPFNDFYDDSGRKDKDSLETEAKQDFMAINLSEEASEQSGSINPFFNSISATTIIVDESSKDAGKGNLIKSDIQTAFN